MTNSSLLNIAIDFVDLPIKIIKHGDFPSFFGTFTRHCPHPMADPMISEDRLELSMPGAALHDIEAFAYAERLHLWSLQKEDHPIPLSDT